MKNTRGDSYLTGKNQLIGPKVPPSSEVSCRCLYDCKKVTTHMKLDLFNKYYELDASGQGTYILSMISKRPAKKYHKDKEVKAKDVVYYSVPNGCGILLRVCKKTFSELKADLLAMVDYLEKEEHKKYYRNLCA